MVKLLKLAATGMFLLLAAALVIGIVGLGPVVTRGQTVRDRPLAELRQLFGGSQIGVSLRDVDETDVTRESLPSQAGAIVSEVERNSPAAEAGFRAGDIVTTFDGERVRSARHLSRLIEETPAGRAVSATVLRGGQSVSLTVSPAASSAFRAFGLPNDLRSFSFTWPDRGTREFRGPQIEPFVVRPEVYGLSGRRARLGVTVPEMGDQLREYFGVTSGLLVTSVDEDTPARAAGIRAGDVITKVGDRQVRSAGDLSRFIAETTGEVAITVVRDKAEVVLKADIVHDPVEAPRRIIR